MDTHPFRKTFDPLRITDLGEAGDEAAYTVDDMVRSLRTADAPKRHSRGWAVLFGALFLAVAAAALSASSIGGGTTPKAAASWHGSPAHSAANAGTRPATGLLGSPATDGSAIRSARVVVVLPADRDAIAGSTIAVAGYVHTRPHAPRAHMVHVELAVGDRVIAATDIGVFSGRFAGVLDFEAPTTPTRAELRISRTTHSLSQPTVRTITIFGAGPDNRS